MRCSDESQHGFTIDSQPNYPALVRVTRRLAPERRAMRRDGCSTGGHWLVLIC